MTGTGRFETILPQPVVFSDKRLLISRDATFTVRSKAETMPVTAQSLLRVLKINLFRYLQSIVNFDPEIPYCALKFCVP